MHFLRIGSGPSPDPVYHGSGTSILIGDGTTLRVVAGGFNSAKVSDALVSVFRRVPAHPSRPWAPGVADGGGTHYLRRLRAAADAAAERNGRPAALGHRPAVPFVHPSAAANFRLMRDAVRQLIVGIVIHAG